MSRPLRVALAALVAVAVVVVLFLVVFPWVDRTFVTDPVLGLVAFFLVPVPVALVAVLV